MFHLPAVCPGSWTSNGVSCYKFVTSDKKTWDQALGMCQDMGGYLATLDSWDEIYWLKGYRSNHPSLRPERMHIGGRKIDGVQYWVHKLAKTPITGFDWAEGEPKEDTNSGACMNLAGDTGYWEKIPQSWFKFDDLWCSYTLSYVCEHDLIVA